MKQLFFLGYVLLTCALNGHADDQTDSLAFELKRHQFLVQNPDERGTVILGAAIELARDGYHSEALELLEDLVDTTALQNLAEDFLPEPVIPNPSALSGPLNTNSIQKPLSIIGYVQSSLQYDNYYLQSQNWSPRAKAKMEWLPKGSSVERLTSIFQGTNQNAYFDFVQKAAFFRRMIKLEMEEQIEKRFHESYGDSLDRAYGDIWVEANSRSLGNAISISLPLRLTLNQYRYDRFGSNSARRFSAQPRLEAISQDLLRSFTLSWDIRQSLYPHSQATNNLQQGPVAVGEWFGERFNLNLSTQYQITNYSRSTSLYLQKEWEAQLGIFIKTWPGFTGGIRASGQGENDSYRDSIELTNLAQVEAKYQLKGLAWTLEPQVEATWGSIYTATLSLAYSQGRYPVITQVAEGYFPFPRYLTNPSIDWKPAFGFTILAKSIFLSLKVEYETNTVRNSEIYNYASTRGIGLDSQFHWKVGSGFEIDFSCNLEKELTGNEVPGRINDMTSLSLGLTKRFP